MDQMTRKHMMMHKGLHPRDDVMCQEKKEEEDMPALKIASTHRRCKGKLITATRNNTNNTNINRTTIIRKEKCEEKQPYGHFKWQISMTGWKGIHWELCKKVKFHHSTKWYMHNQEFVLENETNKIIWVLKYENNYTNCDWCFWYSK